MRKVLGVLLTITVLYSQVVTVNAADINKVSQLHFETESDNLHDLSSGLMDSEIQYEFTESVKDENISTLVETRPVPNKYRWDYNTYAYDFSQQTWSGNKEIFSTYPQNSNGFVMSGDLLNPTEPTDYNVALREGYLNDSEYTRNQGHFYQKTVSAEEFNYITYMLGTNVNVFVYNNDLNLIYRSSDGKGDTSYITSYYSTNKVIGGSLNKVICLGLTPGNYYLVFNIKDATESGGYHYAFYAGQPLPIAKTINSTSIHTASVKWNGYSDTSSMNFLAATITCPYETATEYALTGFRLTDKSQMSGDNLYVSSVDYYYTPPTAKNSIFLSQSMGWGSDYIDTTPPSGSIDGDYKIMAIVHWKKDISYINASYMIMPQITINYLVPFGIVAD